MHPCPVQDRQCRGPLKTWLFPGQSQDWSPGVSGAKSWSWAFSPTRRGRGGPFPKLGKISG